MRIWNDDNLELREFGMRSTWDLGVQTLQKSEIFISNLKNSKNDLLLN